MAELDGTMVDVVRIVFPFQVGLVIVAHGGFRHGHEAAGDSGRFAVLLLRQARVGLHEETGIARQRGISVDARFFQRDEVGPQIAFFKRPKSNVVPFGNGAGEDVIGTGVAETDDGLNAVSGDITGKVGGKIVVAAAVG